MFYTNQGIFKMTRLTIDLPESLHKTLKSISVLDGVTMRNMAISALEQYTIQRVKRDESDFITEDEADELLRPTLMQYAREIEKGEFDGISWEELHQELKEEQD